MRIGSKLTKFWSWRRILLIRNAGTETKQMKKLLTKTSYMDPYPLDIDLLDSGQGGKKSHGSTALTKNGRNPVPAQKGFFIFNTEEK